MASEFARSVAKTITVSNYQRALLHQGPIRTQDVEICEAVDTELQEVREVLAEVIREHDDPMSEYGCTTHTATRVRALMAKLAAEACCGKGPYAD